MATLSARVAKLERAQESSARVGFSIEWWKWQSARKRGDVYAPRLPPGMTLPELDARQQRREQEYLTTPQGQEWKRRIDAALADIDAMPEGNQ